LTICGNAPLTSCQFDPGSCVTVGWSGAVVCDGDAAIDEVTEALTDAVADAVADGFSDGPAGEVARKLP
jgi:hypothetical protein